MGGRAASSPADMRGYQVEAGSGDRWTCLGLLEDRLDVLSMKRSRKTIRTFGSVGEKRRGCSGSASARSGPPAADLAARSGDAGGDHE